MLIVHYSDFCAAPAEVLRRIYTHCELEVEERIFEEQTARISAPTYYKPEFSQADLRAIEAETGKPLERIQRLSKKRGELEAN
jgi:hypothetical protein